MGNEDERDERTDQIIDLIYLLARLKNKRADSTVAATYAQALYAYPPELIRAAIMRCAADPDPFIPPVGAIIVKMSDALMEAGDHPPILPPGDAWRIARRTIGSYHPLTRPNPTAQDPAIDAALRAIGGAAGSQWEDSVGEGITRRAFLTAYTEKRATAEHVNWALTTGGRRAIVYGKEIPHTQLPRFADEAQARGMAIPAWLTEGVDRERAAIVDGSPARDPRTLLGPGSAPALPPERRAALAEDIAASIRTIARERRIPPPLSRDSTEGQIERLMEHFRLQPYEDAETRRIALRRYDNPPAGGERGERMARD